MIHTKNACRMSALPLSGNNSNSIFSVKFCRSKLERGISVFELGKKIKELRKSKNYSARELSERSGVARSLISQLETGKRQSTSMDTVFRLAKALDVPISSIFTEESAKALSSYKQTSDSSRITINEESLPYLHTLQKAQLAGLTPDFLDELIDLILRIRLN